MKQVILHCKQWMEEAAVIIKKELNQEFLIEEKTNKNDLVTHVDKMVEQYLVSKIEEEYPTHYILSEEGFGNFKEGITGTVWIIDPIDGTLNFIHQKENFGISVGIYHNNEPVAGVIYDVMRNDMFVGIKDKGVYLNGAKLTEIKNTPLEQSLVGINARWLIENKRLEHEPLHNLIKIIRGSRSYGSATMEFMAVAKGQLSLYIAPRLGPWDYAAAKIIVKELGGAFVDFDQNEILPFQFSSVIAGSKQAVEELFEKEFIQKK